jgi:Flp pilus assembly protein TadD
LTGFDYGYYVLGLALSFSGEHEEAIAPLSQCTELSPDEDYALAALALTHARAGNREKALERCRS